MGCMTELNQGLRGGSGVSRGRCPYSFLTRRCCRKAADMGIMNHMKMEKVMAAKKKAATKKAAAGKKALPTSNYPRHTIDSALRIPKGIIEQNAGKDCTPKEAAAFVGVGYGGDFQVEVSSCKKYGLLVSPDRGRICVSDLAKQILRPKSPSDEIDGKREAVLSAPEFSEIYGHYRGENLPDEKFFDNTLVDNFRIPKEKLSEFKDIFIKSLQSAKLIEEHKDKWRVLDVSSTSDKVEETATLKKLEKSVSVSAADTCFVMMPFASPLGNYYELIYEPAIRKAGLKPVRADDDIFGTGKIMDQVWSGIMNAKVLVAELTSRNPNVFYELGLAHALKKPVVLVSSNEEDVPFDLHHIRVIYYDCSDPFWGQKLISKVAENVLSAIKNPEEAVFKGASDS